VFDPEAAAREAEEAERLRMEAELAGKIIGVAEMGRDRAQENDRPVAEEEEERDQGGKGGRDRDDNREDEWMGEEQAEEYYLNESYELIDDYGFTIKLSNAMNLSGVTFAAVATYLAANM